MQTGQESITLIFTGENVFKQFNLELVPMDGEWVVNYETFGGNNRWYLGAMTESPVPLEGAKKLYDRLVASKVAEGYTPQRWKTQERIRTPIEAAAPGAHRAPPPAAMPAWSIRGA